MRALRPIAICLLALLSLSGVRTAGDALRGAADPFAEAQFLPVDEAFVLSATLDQDRLVVRWRMAAGYYLYRHAFTLEAGESVALGPLDIPPGKRVVDDYFGASEVYYGDVEISAPVTIDAVARRQESATITARVRYQGCADLGLCYPPQQRTIPIPIPRTDHEAARNVP